MIYGHMFFFSEIDRPSFSTSNQSKIECDYNYFLTDLYDVAQQGVDLSGRKFVMRCS